MKTTPAILVAAAAITVSACGTGTAYGEPATATTSAPTPESTIMSTVEPTREQPDNVTIVLDGGCQMIGPNCPTYELRSDGTFGLRRTGYDAIVAEGSIDADLAGRLWTVIGNTDLATMTAGLGPGSCQACVDGIDTRILMAYPDHTVMLDSADVEFDRSIELFVVLDEALSAMSNAAELPQRSR